MFCCGGIMNSELNNVYRAYYEYLKCFSENKKHQKIREIISKSFSQNEQFEAVHLWCDIEKDWIEIIENGIKYLEKAIDEERQFILQEGNVVPIEKAKRVSRASVEHLARHSDLITHKHEEKTLLPDKILIKENLNNYLVYENRFLYMTLCYLRDFVEIRYNKIIETDNTYYASVNTERDVKVRGREIRFKINYYEKITDDENSIITEEHKNLVKRIEEIRFLISTFLRTDLMKEVSKAPLLHPPITQTNILKMDSNFKEVFKLYEKILSYTKDGYTVKERRIYFTPFSQAVSDDIAELILTISFVVYNHGNALEDVLKSEYEREKMEEKERIKNEKRKLLNRLKKNASEKSMDDYLLELEEYTQMLEDEKKFWKQIDNDNLELNSKIKILRDENLKLNIHLSDIEKQYRKQKEDYVAEINELSSKFEIEKFTIEKDYASNIEDMKYRYIEELESLKSRLEISDQTIEKINGERSLISARLHSALTELGRSLDEDYTSEDRFDELEKERAAYEKFFEGKWKEAKKSIRKKYLWKNYIKKTNK